VVQLQSPNSRLHRFCPLPRIVIAVGKPNVSQGIVPVSFNRPAEVLDPFLDSLWRQPVKVIAAPEIELVSLSITGVALDEPLLLCPGQSQPQFLGDFMSNRFLQSKEVCRTSAVLLAPDLAAILGVDQLSADNQDFTVRQDPAGEDRSDPKFPPDRLRIYFSAFVAKGRVPRDDFQVSQLGKAVYEAFADAFREIFRVWIAAHIDERQDGDRIDHGIRRLISNFPDTCNKAIAAPRNSLDVLALARTLVKRLSLA